MWISSPASFLFLLKQSPAADFCFVNHIVSTHKGPGSLDWEGSCPLSSGKFSFAWSLCFIVNCLFSDSFLCLKIGMVAGACNPSSWETEAGELPWVWKTSLGQLQAPQCLPFWGIGNYSKPGGFAPWLSSIVVKFSSHQRLWSYVWWSPLKVKSVLGESIFLGEGLWLSRFGGRGAMCSVLLDGL